MANLVDHYLLQLKSLLPAKSRDDVAAELGESIRDRLAERERELGRALHDDDIAVVLKTFGHPLIVAGRYLPAQELIGPRMFPLYWYAVQAVLIVIAAITAVLAGIALLTGGGSGLRVLADGFWVALVALACTTIAFAILDHSRTRLTAFEDFDARKLELGIFGLRAAPSSPIPRADTAFEIATLAIFSVWWVGGLDFVNRLATGASVEFTARLDVFFWPVLALAAVDLLRLAVDFVYPYRTWPRVSLRLVLNGCWLAALVGVFRTEGLFAAVGADPAEAIAIAEGAFRVTVGTLALVRAVLIATDCVRLARR